MPTITVPTRSTPILTEHAVDRALFRWGASIATGRRVQWAREQAGISRDELAAYAGMSRATLARVEHGKRTLSGRERAAIARGIGVSIGFLTVGVRNGNGRAAA